MKKILIIDDENIVCEIIKLFLKDSGYEAGYITKPQFILNRLDNDLFDLILLDFNMPQKSGLEVLKDLKSHPIYRNIPVIMLTGERSDSVFAQCFEAGAVDYIKKPINDIVFKSRIKRALDNSEYLKIISEKNQQMELDLELAIEVQKSILSPVLNVPFANIELIYRPESKVSGDFYYFGINSEHKLNVFLGDATGHGISAAFITMMAHIGLAGINNDVSPDNTIRNLNKLMAGRIGSGKFMTAIALTLSQNGELIFCNAGHPSLLIISEKNEEILTFSKRGLAVGIMSEEFIPYSVESYQIEPSDKVIIYTDGLLDMEDMNNNRFEEAILISFLKQNRSLEIKRLIGELLKIIDGFSCMDDLTIIGIELC